MLKKHYSDFQARLTRNMEAHIASGTSAMQMAEPTRQPFAALTKSSQASYRCDHQSVCISEAFFKIKLNCFLDTLILKYIYFLIIQINNFQGDISDISAKTATLVFMYLFYNTTASTQTFATPRTTWESVV